MKLTGESNEVSRKAIAQGRPECSRCPVCSCAVLFAQIARETAGAASTRSSLRPLIEERANEDANLGRQAPRDRETILTSLRAQRSKSISPLARAMDCFAALAMTWREQARSFRTLKRPRRGPRSASRHLRGERDCLRNRPETRADRMSHFADAAKATTWPLLTGNGNSARLLCIGAAGIQASEPACRAPQEIRGRKHA